MLGPAEFEDMRMDLAVAERAALYDVFFASLKRSAKSSKASCGMMTTVQGVRVAMPWSHDPEVQALVVRKVAWDVEGQDLPPALLQDLVAVGPAVDDEAALGGAVLLTKDVLMHAQSPPLDRQVLDSLPFDGRKGRIALQLAEERGEDGAVLEGHGRFTMLTGGSTRISRPPVPAVGSPTMASSLKPDQRARIT